MLGVWIVEKSFGFPHGSFHVAVALADGLGLTIALASVSYHFLELPFLRWKKRFTYVPSRPV
jgi:peptidoglycan/LPS O-acetylase OafA/YrhL